MRRGRCARESRKPRGFGEDKPLLQGIVKDPPEGPLCRGQLLPPQPSLGPPQDGPDDAIRLIAKNLVHPLLEYRGLLAELARTLEANGEGMPWGVCVCRLS